MRKSWFSGFVIGVILTVFLFIVGSSVFLNINVIQLSKMTQIVTLIKTNSLENITSQELFEGASKGMVGALNDPYSVYLDKQDYDLLKSLIQGYAGLGIYIGLRNENLTVVAPIYNTPAYKAGILTGDIILKIDDRETKYMDLNVAASLMRGEPGTPVVIEVFREEIQQILTFEIIREFINIPSIEGKILEKEPQIAYVNITSFNNRTYPDLVKTLADLDKYNFNGLILDLRDNYGGDFYAAINVADYFLPEGPIVYKVSGNKTEVIESKSPALGVPLVVIVNNASASASEILAGAIKDRGIGTLVGTQTFGKGLVQTIFPLNDETALKLTTHKYLTPNKVDINKKGITPDVIIERDKTIDEDTQLKQAIEILRNEL